MINKLLNNETYKNKIVPISFFLVVELMFLLAFNLGDLGNAYRLIAFILAVLLLPTFLKSLNEDMAKGFIFVFLPLVIYLLSMAFSPVFGQHADNLYSPSISLLNRGFFTLLMSFVGGIAFLVLGYFVSRTNVISKTNFIFLIYGGIALLLFVSLMATLVNYGFFHRMLYGDKVNYFEGTAYPINAQANLLMGFNIVTVDYHVLITLGLLVITPAFALVFFKEVKKMYMWILVSFAFLGIITLVLLTDYRSLIFVIPALLLALMLKFKLHQMKYFKLTMFIVLGLGLFSILLGVLASFEVGFVESLLNSNPLTRRLYYNGYTLKYMAIIKEAIDPNFLFGNPYNYSLDNLLIFPSGNLILDTLKETGIVGLIGFVGLIVIGVKVAITYLNLSTDSVVTKYMVIAFLLTLLTRYMLRYPFNQLTFTDSYWDINYFPFVESKEFAISLFLLGYMYVAKPLTIKPNLEEATVNE
ncbi:MAG: hypothetical protein AB7E23_01185 [Bacilli bacterium]